MLIVEAKVIEGVITSSPSLIPRAVRVRCIPAVAEFSAIACPAEVSLQNLSSNSLHNAPVVIQPDLRQDTTLFISASPMEGLLKGRNSFLIFIYSLLSKLLIANMQQVERLIIPQDIDMAHFCFYFV